MTEIGIAEALSQINTPLDGDRPRLFSIAWIRKSGPERGTLKTVLLARKHSKTDKSSGNGTKGNFNLRRAKTLFLDDVTNPQSPQPLYVGIETIVRFNGKRVRH